VVNVALLGLGTVGSGVVNILQDPEGRDPLLKQVNLIGVGVHSKTKPRPDSKVTPALLTEDSFALVQDPKVEVVIEVVGTVDIPLRLIRAALKAGKHVVTANKALMARHGTELLALAQSQGVHLRYEAAVGGGIPLIQPLHQCLGANRVSSLLGIVNGTTNYILTKMTQEGRSYTSVLAEAQQLGYAEANPAADVEGYDAQEKLAILASIIFRNQLVPLDSIPRKGITGVTDVDIRYAAELGYAIKLVAVANRTREGLLDLRVHPALVPHAHPLSKVDNAFNAVMLESDPLGQIMFYGPGAGAGPTASAVVADLINILTFPNNPMDGGFTETYPLLPIDEVETRFYCRLKAKNHPGVIGQLGQAFGDAEVSLESIVQKAVHGPDQLAELVIITHKVKTKRFNEAIQKIQKLSSIASVDLALRVLGEG
jgi:homoserine dehydrogenase